MSCSCQSCPSRRLRGRTAASPSLELAHDAEIGAGSAVVAELCVGATGFPGQADAGAESAHGEGAVKQRDGQDLRAVLARDVARREQEPRAVIARVAPLGRGSGREATRQGGGDTEPRPPRRVAVAFRACAFARPARQRVEAKLRGCQPGDPEGGRHHRPVERPAPGIGVGAAVPRRPRLHGEPAREPALGLEAQANLPAVRFAGGEVLAQAGEQGEFGVRIL